MDILDDMGVSKLSAKVFSKVNYSFKLVLDWNACLCCFYWKATAKFCLKMVEKPMWFKKT